MDPSMLMENMLRLSATNRPEIRCPMNIIQERTRAYAELEIKRSSGLAYASPLCVFLLRLCSYKFRRKAHYHTRVTQESLILVKISPAQVI